MQPLTNQANTSRYKLKLNFCLTFYSTYTSRLTTKVRGRRGENMTLNQMNFEIQNEHCLMTNHLITSVILY